MPAAAGFLVLSMALAGCFGGPPGDTGTVSEPSDPPQGIDPEALGLAVFTEGVGSPVWLAQPAGPDGDVYVVGLGGTVWRTDADGTRDGSPWLDVTGRVGSGGERGLFSIAFHPDWPEDPRFWVHYTDTGGDTVVSEWTASEGEDGRMVADDGSEQKVLTRDQPYGNHNGGGMLFGPDGMLYIALGDGGSAHDPLDTGQDPTDLLGSILRIDIDVAGGAADGRAYAVPDDNPFVGRDGADEVWHYGLRNPWRFSFDRGTGDMWIGDVGQNEMEEVDHAPSGTGGLNFGWKVWEGDRRHRSGETREEATFPVAVYELVQGRCAVTGGFVYRGEAIPELQGTYVFGDYCTGEVWGLGEADGARVMFPLMDVDFNLPSFGEDASGELYLLDQGGTVWRLVST